MKINKNERICVVVLIFKTIILTVAIQNTTTTHRTQLASAFRGA